MTVLAYKRCGGHQLVTSRAKGLQVKKSPDIRCLIGEKVVLPRNAGYEHHSCSIMKWPLRSRGGPESRNKDLEQGRRASERLTAPREKVMLDAFIIEEIKRQEEERRREQERRPTIPLEDDDVGPPARQGNDEGETDRGVVIIDYSA